MGGDGFDVDDEYDRYRRRQRIRRMHLVGVSMGYDPIDRKLLITSRRMMTVDPSVRWLRVRLSVG